MKAYTAKAFEGLPIAARTNAVRAADNPIPDTALAGHSPIKFCVYIIKENRTYDQMLGDLPQGNGDPSLCLFPRNISPNHHHLAEEFVLLDNFYVDAEVSADGHEWTMGAYATDFVEKMWPLSYGHNSAHKKYHYPSEGNFPIATPAGGYLWDRAKEAGVSYRSYGEFVANGKNHNVPSTPRVPALKGHFDPFYWGFDVKYPDVNRAARFISELQRFEKEGEMPRLQVVRLPNDHTGGAGAAYHTPSALVADNDLALGRVVEALSRSKFWPQTAIFVVEDDAQNGPDHVDAHRTIAYVISPYVKKHSVDSTLYSTSSMLRTMELILGLKPMSQFDAGAMPMYQSFQAKPDPAPYKALAANIDLNEMNKKTAWGGHLKLNLAREDAVDDLLLNRIVWHSIKGSASVMPPPTRAAWVRQTDQDDD
jgi:phospholipase C